jgi:hypothetical protein
MTSRARRCCIAALVGCLPVLVAARELNSVTPSWFVRTVLAPVPILVSLVPTPNIGTTNEPVYEGTPLHLAVALAALPLCAIIYTMTAYAALTFAECLFRGGPNKAIPADAAKGPPRG